MFKIKNSTIHCSRGDSGTILLKVPITDINDYIKYVDNDENVYWYNPIKKKLYNSNYEEVEISIDTLTMVLYEFQVDDEIKFNIYERQGYNKEPLKTKTIINDIVGNSIEIPLTDEDTTFGNIENKPITYWYDITLNGDQTIVCYNENGAREFIQYPAKGDDE